MFGLMTWRSQAESRGREGLGRTCLVLPSTGVSSRAPHYISSSSLREPGSNLDTTGGLRLRVRDFTGPEPFVRFGFGCERDLDRLDPNPNLRRRVESER